jgi:hypothetical protein
MAFRIDKGSYTRSRAKKLPNGFLMAPATLTRTGVFQYLQQDGSIRRELRLPEEVFAADSLATLHLVPVTSEHPKDPVDIDNVRHLSIGTTGQDAKADGDNVVATLQLQDKSAIKDAEEGRRSEVSCGYWCDSEKSPGVYKGDSYDVIQRNIRYNHVAMTVRGRAGNARIHLDSADGDYAEMVGLRCDAYDRNPGKKGQQPMKLTIDGITFEVENVQLAQAVNKAMGERDEQISALKADSEKLIKDKSEAEARAAVAEKDLDKTKKAREDAQKPEHVQELVKARLDLERRAGPLLADQLKKDNKEIESLSDDEIRRAVIAIHSPDLKLDGKDEAFVSTYCEAALVSLADRQDSDAKRSRHKVEDAAANLKARDDSESKDAEEAYRKDTQEAWQKPLHNTGS